MQKMIDAFAPAQYQDLYRGAVDAVDGIVKSFPEGAWKQRIKGDEELNGKIKRAISESGLMGLGVAEEFGGMGGGLFGQVMITDLFWRKGIGSFSDLLSAFCRTPLLKFGTEEQIENYAKPTITGEKAFCILATEPNAGTNTFRVSTKATKKNGKWILNGQKTFITEAAKADYGFLIARTDMDKPGALSIFVVDMKKTGVSMQKLNINLGGGESQYTVFFDDVELPEDALIGEEGKGGRYMFEGLNAERLIVSAMCLGVSNLAMEVTTDYVGQRNLFGDKPTGAYQGVQHPLAQCKAELDAARLMMYYSTKLFDQNEEVGLQANSTKLLASNAANKLCDAALQFHGGSGMDEDTGILYMWRWTRTLRIAPINNEMILNYIAEHALGLPKSY